VVDAEVIADFLASKKFGVERIREISEAASIKLDLPPGALERYLTDNINFDLDAENLEGLKLYFDKAAATGLIPRTLPVEFVTSIGRGSAPSASTRAARS
jgi:predicted solute-binding protein